jgi:hypothetical protein
MEEKKQMDEEKKLETVPDPIIQEPTKGHMLDIGASTISVELPNGHIDADGKVHCKVAFKEMSGVEEDLLGGSGPVQPRMNAIVAGCTVQFGSLPKEEFSEAANNLTATDRMVALLNVRRVSLGDYYDVKLPCPNKDCRKENRHSIDLRDLKIAPMKERHNRQRSDTLKSGVVVDWHIMTADDEEWLTTKRKKLDGYHYTLALISRVDAINGKKIDRERSLDEALGILVGLPSRIRNEIRGLFLEHEGSVDTKVTFECPDCGFEWNADMPVGQPGFFFPSGI